MSCWHCLILRLFNVTSGVLLVANTSNMEDAATPLGTVLEVLSPSENDAKIAEAAAAIWNDVG